jgi:hypothetical protein
MDFSLADAVDELRRVARQPPRLHRGVADAAQEHRASKH